jgi:hypothetical protein
MTSKDAEKGDDNTDVGSMVDMVDSYISNADLIPDAGKIVLGMLIYSRECVWNLVSERYSSNLALTIFKCCFSSSVTCRPGQALGKGYHLGSQDYRWDPLGLRVHQFEPKDNCRVVADVHYGDRTHLDLWSCVRNQHGAAHGCRGDHSFNVLDGHRVLSL